MHEDKNTILILFKAMTIFWTFYLTGLCLLVHLTNGRIFAARNGERERVARNMAVEPMVITDGEESLLLHEYLYRALWLQNKFAKGAAKHFNQIPDIAFRHNEHIYQTSNDDHNMVFPKISQYINCL